MSVFPLKLSSTLSLYLSVLSPVFADKSKMAGFKSYFPTSALYTPTNTMGAFAAKASAPTSSNAGFKHPAAGFMAPSSQEYGMDYFLKGA